jgi:hypothetical protein
MFSYIDFSCLTGFLKNSNVSEFFYIQTKLASIDWLAIAFSNFYIFVVCHLFVVEDMIEKGFTLVLLTWKLG